MNEHMKKILISDYDQTFYLNDDDIEKNKAAVEKFREEGNKFIIATGRSYFDIQKEINKYEIKYDFLIINHGASILDESDNVIYNFPIDNEVVNQLKRELESIIPNMTLHSEFDKYTTPKNKYFCCSEKSSRLDFNNKDITKINLKLESEKLTDKVHSIINDKYSDYINCYKVSEDIIEIISNKINKFKAIELLASYYNFDPNSIYTIGDGYSDLEMVKNYNGYAMKDSIEELKKVANKEYESVSELINEII